jgi:hypothetical protein
MIRQQFLYQGRQRTSIIGRRPLGSLFQLGIDAHVNLRRFSLDHLRHSNRFALGSQYYVLTFAPGQRIYIACNAPVKLR